MKPQYIIFILVIVWIIFLVYPSDRADVDQARERMMQRQENDLVGRDESNWGEQDIQETAQTETPSSPDIWEIWEQADENMRLWNIPAESLDVREVMDINTPSLIEYGDAVITSDTSFIYNQVRGLEIYREQIDEELTCDGLTEFLTARLRAWYFWNTCRFIDWERWLKFNVLRLMWDEYIYERHYIDQIASLYAILELERWEWIDKDMLPEKNAEYRDKEFPLIEVWDGLMRKLVQSN